jgi:hypothetical protein
LNRGVELELAVALANTNTNANINAEALALAIKTHFPVLMPLELIDSKVLALIYYYY